VKSESTEGFGAGAILLAFVAGALAGAGVALLLAPQAGVATRARIGDAMGQAGDQARRTREAARAAAGAAEKAFREAMRDVSRPVS
jgi:gas vesicle protein